jgi:hypothetical protein
MDSDEDVVALRLQDAFVAAQGDRLHLGGQSGAFRGDGVELLLQVCLTGGEVSELAVGFGFLGRGDL